MTTPALTVSSNPTTPNIISDSDLKSTVTKNTDERLIKELENYQDFYSADDVSKMTRSELISNVCLLRKFCKTTHAVKTFVTNFSPTSVNFSFNLPTTGACFMPPEGSTTQPDPLAALSITQADPLTAMMNFMLQMQKDATAKEELRLKAEELRFKAVVEERKAEAERAAENRDWQMKRRTRYKNY